MDLNSSGPRVLHNNNLSGIKGVFSVHYLPINEFKVRVQLEMKKYIMYGLH